MPSSVVSGVGCGVHIVPLFVVVVAQDDLITFYGERLLYFKQYYYNSNNLFSLHHDFHIELWYKMF